MFRALALFIVVFTGLSATAKKVEPDLSFNGFAMVIDEIKLPDGLPALACDTLKENLVAYQKLESKNLKLYTDYALALAKVFASWHTELAVYTGEKIYFTKSSLEPVASLQENFSETRTVRGANADTIAYLFLDSFDVAETCDLSKDLVWQMQVYSDAVAESYFHFDRYLADVSIILSDIELSLNSFVGENNNSTSKLFDEEILTNIASFLGAEMFSGGLEEAVYNHKLVFEKVYASELQTLIDALPAADPSPTP